MNANFFNQLMQLQITGDLHLTIAKGTQNNLIVSVMLQNQACGDNAKNIIPPLNLRGTAEELDNGFFEKITAPIQTASGVMVDMEAFLKQLEQAKKQSASAKEKAEIQNRQLDSRDKKFKDAMANAVELEKEGKHREAWMKVPEIAEYPEKAEEIRRRKKQLSDQFSAPSLFGAVEEQKTEPSKEGLFPDFPAGEAHEDMPFEQEEEEDENQY